jgi:soluble lytic murein transglycosylase
MKLLVVVALALCACSWSSEGGHQASAAGQLATREPAPRVAQSDELKRAQAAIEQGHPWVATQIVAPLLRDPATRTPAAVIVAARAAAGWEGWAEVDRLLANESWLDTQFAGEGRELLARSALDRAADTVALTQASAALRDASGAAARATRQVLLARALERNNMFDSAAVLYGRSSDTFRSIRDWLALRVAGNESDSTKRSALLASISLGVAKPRVAWTDAQAHERFGDAAGAAKRYASLGATVTSFRLRLSVAPDSATRAAIKTDLLSFIRGHPGSADAKSAVEVLDKGFATLTPAEELVIARGIAAAGPVPRAILAFERASTQPALITAADQLQYAQLLARAGRTRDAMAHFDAVKGPSALEAQAGYQRARMLLASSSADATRAALRDVVARFPGDTAAASAALFLLADLSTDTGEDAQARTLYRQLYQNYPGSPRAADARFNAAMIALVDGDDKTAAVEMDSLFALLPRSDEANAARYWSGRAWAAAGNASLARTRWQEALAQQPASYYASASARRLGENAWTPTARGDVFAHFAPVDSAMARAALLERLGMDVEARFEYDALEAAATKSPELLATTAHAFLERGQPTRTTRLAQKLIDGGQRDARAYRLLFPVVDGSELTRDATAHGLDPALVAGLIRQESGFNARAVSVANARGLMQVLPAVGEEVARSLNYPVWYPALLLDADANLQLGTAHLAAYMKQYGPLARVLAAYNAGGSRVARWVTKAGTNDPEVFVERIPFTETRDYVRVVQRNADMYRALYPALGAGGGARGTRE